MKTTLLTLNAKLIKKMKKYYVFLAILIGCMTMASCSKSSDNKQSENVQSEKPQSETDKIFASAKTAEEFQGKYLISKDNQCIVYFIGIRGNTDIQINIKEKGLLVSGWCILKKDANPPYLSLVSRKDDGSLEGKMTANRLEITVFGEKYIFDDFRIITEEEAADLSDL